MTKKDEMAILDEAIAKLGRDSYCGAWLSSVRAEVENDVKCDIFPSASIAEAERASRVIRAAANDFYESRTKSARETAQRIVDDARKNAEAVYTAALRDKKADLAQLIRNLQRTQEAL